MIGATFEAIALRWEGAAVADLGVDTSDLRERLETLSAAGVHVVLVGDGPPEETNRHLSAGPQGPGTLHLCSMQGTALLDVTDVRGGKAGAAPVDTTGPTSVRPLRALGAPDRMAAFLEDRGITGTLILIIDCTAGSATGSEGAGQRGLGEVFPRAVVVSVGGAPVVPEDGVVAPRGGPEHVLSLLDEQLTRRAEHRVPQIDRDPAWTVPLPDDRDHERMAEALAALCNGSSGTRGSRGEVGPDAAPLFVVNGVYAADGHLLPGPVWTGFDCTDAVRPPSVRRLLDLRGGTLYRFGDDSGALRSLRFASVAKPRAMALRVEGPEASLEPGDSVRPPAATSTFRSERTGDRFGATTGDHHSGIAVAARDRITTTDGLRIVERLAAWTAVRTGVARLDEAYEQLTEVEAQGFDRALADHREAWARRWTDAEVTIDGDPEAELAARFAVFHLLSAASDHGESAVGARGMTGSGYAGHVFWDADVFVLPALAAIRPAAARSMLEYRIRRLPAAHAAARALGRDGARFPWESAGDGSDVTPHQVIGPDGTPVDIATGPQEEHIVADVAWAATHYASWTGDAGFLAGPGRPLLVDTARYWASRIETDGDGSGHIRGVVGPDEYHVDVADNAYTNVMARWNLRQGASLLAEDGASDEASRWLDLAASLYDGWDPATQRYEQFHGYFDLEPLLMSEVGTPPIAVDVLLGAERVSGSQLIKQADVLMAHQLVPEALEAGSLRSCLDYYEPRTAHGSSLSPAVSATLLARAGEPERALALFRLAARLDLDNTTGATADGLHLATMGGVWQALAFGFLGLAADEETLVIRPTLPDAWHALTLSFRYVGQPVRVRAEADHVTVTCASPLPVDVDGQGASRCPSGTTSFERAGLRHANECA